MISALEAFLTQEKAICAQRGEGRHQYARCILCGCSVFVCSLPTADQSSYVEHVEIAPSDCERCAPIIKMHPDIHAWIVGVFANMRLLIELAKS